MADLSRDDMARGLALAGRVLSQISTGESPDPGPRARAMIGETLTQIAEGGLPPKRALAYFDELERVWACCEDCKNGAPKCGCPGEDPT
jgi:hypothetical protein